MVHEVKDLLQVDGVHIDPHPDAVVVGEVVRVQVEDEGVDLEVPVVALDGQVGVLAAVVQLLEAVEQEGRVVGPDHSRGSGHFRRFCALKFSAIVLVVSPPVFRGSGFSGLSPSSSLFFSPDFRRSPLTKPLQERALRRQS